MGIKKKLAINSISFAGEQIDGDDYSYDFEVGYIFETTTYYIELEDDYTGKKIIISKSQYKRIWRKSQWSNQFTLNRDFDNGYVYVDKDNYLD